MYAKNKGHIVAELIHLMTISGQYVDEQKQFCKYVTNIVKKYRKKESVKSVEEAR